MRQPLTLALALVTASAGTAPQRQVLPVMPGHPHFGSSASRHHLRANPNPFLTSGHLDWLPCYTGACIGRFLPSSVPDGAPPAGSIRLGHTLVATGFIVTSHLSAEHPIAETDICKDEGQYQDKRDAHDHLRLRF